MSDWASRKVRALKDREGTDDEEEETETQRSAPQNNIRSVVECGKPGLLHRDFWVRFLPEHVLNFSASYYSIVNLKIICESRRFAYRYEKTP